MHIACRSMWVSSYWYLKSGEDCGDTWELLRAASEQGLQGGLQR